MGEGAKGRRGEGAQEELEPTAAFRGEAQAYGIEFDDGDLARLGRYLALLLEETTKFNLTAIRDPAEAWMKHVFDSLTLLPWVPDSTAARVIDVGSGGGLPGLPLAICCPQAAFTLLEATGKKARFLSSCAAELDLHNVTVECERAETAGHDRRHREQYDLVVARAVGPLAVLLELTVPLARVDGHVLAIKGARAAEELAQAKAALHLLHAAAAGTTRTPTGTIVDVVKCRATPRGYPRRPGEPRRVPLGGRPGPPHRA